MSTQFETILNLELWHDFFLNSPEPSSSARAASLPAGYDLSQVLALVPTHDCSKTLRQLRWLIRSQPQGAVLLAQLDSRSPEALTPIVAIAPTTRLTFWLELRDRNFFNYTNLPLTTPNNQLYYFSNRSANANHDPNQVSDQATQPLYLSQALSPYRPNTPYPLGHLVTYNTPSHPLTLEAARPQVPQGPIPTIINSTDLRTPTLVEEEAAATGTAATWISSSLTQYASAKDSLPRQSPHYQHSLSAANPGETHSFSLVGIHQQTTFTQTVTIPPDHLAGQAFSVLLDFSSQSPGCYQLRLNDQPIKRFIVASPPAGRQALALVELVVTPPSAGAPSPFQLLSADGKTLQPKTYRIHFKNRSTYWRYHDTSHQKTYVTQHPVGLNHRPTQRITDANNKRLPTPNNTLVTPVVGTTANGSRRITAIFSDIYL